MAERENRREGRGGNDRRDNREEATPEFADRLVAINRVSKTVKGGKRFGFAALAGFKLNLGGCVGLGQHATAVEFAGFFEQCIHGIDCHTRGAGRPVCIGMG